MPGSKHTALENAWSIKLSDSDWVSDSLMYGLSPELCHCNEIQELLTKKKKNISSWLSELFATEDRACAR